MHPVYVPVRPIRHVSQTYAHVVHHRSGNGKRNRNPQNGMGNHQRINIAVTQKKQARNQSPDERDRREHGIGQMRRRKQRSRCQRRQPLAWDDAQKAQQKTANHPDDCWILMRNLL